MDRCVGGPIIRAALQSTDVLLIWPCDSCCSPLPTGTSDGSVAGQFFLGHVCSSSSQVNLVWEMHYDQNLPSGARIQLSTLLVQGIQLSTLEATANWLSALYELFNLLFGLDKFYSNIGPT
jgi:hypothetical protein